MKYIAMAGLHGCLPNYCEEYERYEDAVDGLVSLHELDEQERICLWVDQCLELELEKHGNAYCEVITKPIGLD
jgi:hypothetical protein|tara:strand:- start:251 stop:469 length:219 start_codon:yes stop_codon:yes gene_type:complete